MQVACPGNCGDSHFRSPFTVSRLLLSPLERPDITQCDIVPLTLPTFSRPTWPWSTAANACETNG